MSECINGPHIIECCEVCCDGEELGHFYSIDSLLMENEKLKQKLVNERELRLWDRYFKGGKIKGNTWVKEDDSANWMLEECEHDPKDTHHHITQLRLSIPNAAKRVLTERG